MDEVLKLAIETINLNKQAIVFVTNRPSAEKTAEEIAKLTSLSLQDLEKEILSVASTPTKQCRRLSHCIKKGIAFHHAGLLEKQRDLIEDEFRKGTIKIICATPTLAAGLSLPVFRVIIKTLKRYSEQWGMDWIAVLEYLQMAGRAGRPEYEKYGEAICVATTNGEKDEIYERYICGVPEDIYSKLAVEPVLRTYLLSLISSGIIKDEETMNNFFSQTFWAYQFQDLAALQRILEKMLHLLVEWEFVLLEGKKEEVAFQSAKELDNLKRMRATLLGRRVSELYLDPLTAHHILTSLRNFNSSKNSFSLLAMISHTLEMRPLLRIKSRELEKIQEELNKRYDSLLEKEPSIFDHEYEEFMNAIKTSLFFEGWMEEFDEEYLLETYDIRPGEIKAKLDVADWLLYATEELSKIIEHKEAIKEIRKLRIRLQYGAKEELLPLLRLKGIGRIRARKLYSNGLKDLGNLKEADLTTLTQILGKAIAEDVKKQLGEEIEEVSPRKRSGQVSLGKFEKK